MPASDELLNQINECIHALQDAQNAAIEARAAVARLDSALTIYAVKSIDEVINGVSGYYIVETSAKASA